jgi:Phage integrase family
MWHLLRHTYASILAAGGIRREVVERLMGHAPRGSTTVLYTHLFKDAFEGVQEALDAVFCVNDTSTDSNVTNGNHETPEAGLNTGSPIRGRILAPEAVPGGVRQ